MINYDGLFDKDHYSSVTHSNHFCSDKLDFVQIENALVLPVKLFGADLPGGGIITQSGDYVVESSVHNGSHKEYAVPEDEIIQSDETVIYLGMLIGIWGHCISDCIKRAWIFHSEIYKEKYSDLRVIYVAQEGSLHDNFKALLDKIGINISSFTLIDKPTRFARIILPDSSFFLDDQCVEHFTKEYVETIDLIKEQYKKSAEEITKKVYYSHKNVRGFNNDIGEEKLEAYFKKQGYDIIHPENLSFDEQLDIMSRCCSFAATDGSTSHNSIFIPDNSEIIIIPRSPYLTFHQLALNELYPMQKIFYIDSSLSIFCKGDRPTRGPFFYYVSDKLISHVENSVFHETRQYVRENFYDFNKYIKRGMYVEDGRIFTACSPYTELAFYYYNKYLFLSPFKTKAVSLFRKLEYFFFRVKKKLHRLTNK